MITITCPVCQKPFQAYPRTIRRNKTPTCSRQCNGKLRGAEWATHGHKGRAAWTDANRASYREKMTGPNNPAWKGGATYFKTHGNYTGVKYVRCPEHYRAMARADGYVMEHRLIMARMARRCLTRREVVHHIDHDPQNNAPSNLELWPTNAAHKLWEHGRFVPGVACRVFLGA